MLDFDLKAVIERLTAKVADDLRHAGKSDARVRTVTCDAPATYSEKGIGPIGKLEQTSLKALISWVAFNCSLTEEQIALRLARTFNADSITEIDASDFDNAVAWLVDFKPVLN